MTLKELFEGLGAPLVNARWSWGSVRADGVAFLRVWQDQVIRRTGTLYVRLTFGSPKEAISPGYTERRKHVELVRKGAPSFLIMCQAKDRTAHIRTVRDFEREDVFRGGSIVKRGNAWWIELGPRLPSHEAFFSRGEQIA